MHSEILILAILQPGPRHGYELKNQRWVAWSFSTTVGFFSLAWGEQPESLA